MWLVALAAVVAVVCGGHTESGVSMAVVGGRPAAARGGTSVQFWRATSAAGDKWGFSVQVTSSAGVEVSLAEIGEGRAAVAYYYNSGLFIGISNAAYTAFTVSAVYAAGGTDHGSTPSMVMLDVPVIFYRAESPNQLFRAEGHSAVPSSWSTLLGMGTYLHFPSAVAVGGNYALAVIKSSSSGGDVSTQLVFIDGKGSEKAITAPANPTQPHLMLTPAAHFGITFLTDSDVYYIQSTNTEGSSWGMATSVGSSEAAGIAVILNSAVCAMIAAQSEFQYRLSKDATGTTFTDATTLDMTGDTDFGLVATPSGTTAVAVTFTPGFAYEVFPSSASASTTPTPTPTPSSSATPSPPESSSPSSSPSASPTPTPSPSSTPSSSPSSSPTPTPSPSRTATPAASRTRTSSPSASFAVSSSPTTSPSATTSRTRTPSPSPSVTPSATPSPSPSPSSSTSPSRTSIPSASPTHSPSPCPSSSPSPSTSPSPSPSPSAFPSLSPTASASPSVGAIVPRVITVAAVGQGVNASVAARAASELAVTSPVVLLEHDTAAGAVEVALPVSPAPGEVVTLTCRAGAAVFVSPAVVQFTDAVWTPALVQLTSVEFSVPDAEVAVVEDFVCDVSSAGATRDVYATTTSTRRANVVVINQALPLYADAVVQRDSGVWESAVQGPTTFSLTLNTASVLELSASEAGTFLPTVSVSVGDVMATMLNVSRDVITVETPPFAALCPNASLCAAQGGYFPLVVDNGDPGPLVMGGEVACPPNCGPVTVPSGGGVFLTPSCAGYPSGSVCLEESTAAQCAHGVGDSCAPCPANSFCPGGSRLWPQPGFWAASEAATSVTECPPPALERCLGWDTSEAAAACAVGYDSRAPACRGCTNGYYSELSGACSECPSAGNGVMLLLLFASGVVAVIASTGLVLVTVARRRGENVKLAITRARDFAVYTLTVLQTVSQVGKRSVAGPQPLQSLYSKLTWVELDISGAVHPSCLSAYPFFNEAAQFCAVLVLLAVAGLGVWNASRAAPESKAAARLALLTRVAMSLLFIGYPLVTTSALRMAHCESGVEGLGGWRLASNPWFQCFHGDHTPVGVLSLVVLPLFSVGFPALVFAGLWPHRGVATKRSTPWQNSWATFLRQDFAPSEFYFHVVNMGVLFALALLVVFGTSPSIGTQTAVFLVSCMILVGCAVLYVRVDPYLKADDWKLPVKVGTLVVSVIGAFVNFLSAVEATTSDDGVGTFRDVVAWAVLLACCGLVATFLFIFWFNALHRSPEGAPAKPSSWHKWCGCLLKSRHARKTKSLNNTAGGWWSNNPLRMEPESKEAPEVSLVPLPTAHTRTVEFGPQTARKAGNV